MTLNHIHLGTKNMELLQKFYVTHFGFEKSFVSDGTVFLQNKMGFLIAIDTVEELPVLPEWYHLGFCLETEKEVLEMYQRMKASQEKIVRELKQDSGKWASFFVTDPDGNKIEIRWS